MNFFSRNWKAFLALFLLIAAILVLVLLFMPARDSYERDKADKENQISLYRTQIETVQKTINENLKYEDIQDDLLAEAEKIEVSREELYAHFPAELREEDQIMYVLYLEELFGNDIQFAFGDTYYMARLSDGSELGVLVLDVNYVATYEAFQELVDYLATDSRITSVELASMNYDETSDNVFGFFRLYRYVLVPSGYNSGTDYQEPEVDTSDEVGKENIFD